MRYAAYALIVGLLAALPASAQTPIDYRDPSVTTAPKFDPRKSTPPEYPSASMRAGETGTTKLRICLAKDGKVTDVTLTESSGSQRLDEVTMAWVKKGARFAPAKAGETAIAVCGFPWQQVWRLQQ